jgi:hypothetical protein
MKGAYDDQAPASRRPRRRRAGRPPARGGPVRLPLLGARLLALLQLAAHGRHRDLRDLAARRHVARRPRRWRRGALRGARVGTALIVAALGFVGLAAARGEPRELHLRDGHDRLQDRGGPAPRQHAASEAARIQGQPRRLLGADGTRPLPPRGRTHVSRWSGRVALGLLILGKRLAPNRPVSLLVLVAGIAAVPLLGLAGRGVAASARCRRACPCPACPRSALRREHAPAPGHGVLPARRGGDVRHRADVRPQARLPARQQPGVPRAGRQQPGGRPRAGLPGERRHVAVAGERGGGARTPLSGLVAAGSWDRGHPLPRLCLHDLPQPVLAAVVLMAVSGLFKLSDLRRLWRFSRAEFAVAAAAILGVLGSGLLRGVLIGVVISLLLLRGAPRGRAPPSSAASAARTTSRT